MTFVMFATWALVGALAGVLAGLVMKPGGHGLKTDILLALAGSFGGSWIFRGLVYADAGMATTVVVAAIGAAIPLVVQRTKWPTERFPASIGGR
jgi:uncharacterized membrane protein YeaQ/YmgE (transglycosylase-associated protein family)